jgi:hypothetical protein
MGKRGRLTMLKPQLHTLAPRLRTVTPGSWRAGKSTSARGYTYRWKQFRLAWLAEHPLCGDREEGRSGEHSACVRAGRVSAGTVVDHIQPHRGDWEAFWRGPFQTLCASCHSSLKQQEEANAG